MPGAPATTYTNPVYSGSFPDPFVLKHEDHYFAFCTGHADDGRIFGVLTSTDLVEWQKLPGALHPLPPEAGPFYWAPEVAHHDGMFYLYYSVGNETLMEIRVATSKAPAGPYSDTGRKLTPQDFAIDPHVFMDDDGSWHMFYATDFLDYSHVGTGTVVDRMLDPLTLAGNAKPVTRAKYDWQVYDPARKEKGGVRWHTVEGPFVLKRKGSYFEMFSGGNWQNITYGVGYAVSDNIDADREWRQQVDGIETLPLLSTIPDKVIGPGHNSVVVGPDGRELYCVYHRWEKDKRMMCIDRMDFAGGDRLFVAGPSYGPQRAPFLASSESFEDSFDDDFVTRRDWSIEGHFRIENKTLVIDAKLDDCVLKKNVPAGDFKLAINLRIDAFARRDASIALGSGDIVTLVRAGEGGCFQAGETEITIPDFQTGKFYQVGILSEGGEMSILFDGIECGCVAAAPGSGCIEIVVRHANVTLDMVRYTSL